jgi:hypothetical protein
MMLRHPQFFAAGAPLASGGASSRNLESIAHIPIWTFHTQDDPDVSVQGVRNTVSQLRAAGGNVFLSETPGVTHDAWTIAFRDFRLLDWLLAQQQGVPGPAPDHTRFGIQFQLLKQRIDISQALYYLVLPATLLAFYWFARRQFRRHRYSR